MPTTYAHKKFGALVYKNLPKETKALVADNYEFFLAGLHGPDILFFHKPGLKSELPGIGKAIHRKPFKLFYEKSVKHIKDNEYEEDIVYLLGSICHFVLDKECHPLVADAVNETGMSHGKIEMEFDRELLLKDGHTPIKYPTYAHIPISKEVAIVASGFYKGTKEGQVFTSLATMKTAYAACSTGNASMRKLICKVMDMAGSGEKVASLVMSKDRSQMAKEYVKKMSEALYGAVGEAVADIETALLDIAGEIKKNPEYRYNYLGKKIG